MGIGLIRFLKLWVFWLLLNTTRSQKVLCLWVAMIAIRIKLDLLRSNEVRNNTFHETIIPDNPFKTQ